MLIKVTTKMTLNKKIKKQKINKRAILIYFHKCLIEESDEIGSKTK